MLLRQDVKACVIASLSLVLKKNYSISPPSLSLPRSIISGGGRTTGNGYANKLHRHLSTSPAMNHGGRNGESASASLSSLPSPTTLLPVVGENSGRNEFKVMHIKDVEELYRMGSIPAGGLLPPVKKHGDRRVHENVLLNECIKSSPGISTLMQIYEESYTKFNTVNNITFAFQMGKFGPILHDEERSVMQNVLDKSSTQLLSLSPPTIISLLKASSRANVPLSREAREILLMILVDRKGDVSPLELLPALKALLAQDRVGTDKDWKTFKNHYMALDWRPFTAREMATMAVVMSNSCMLSMLFCSRLEKELKLRNLSSFDAPSLCDLISCFGSTYESNYIRDYAADDVMAVLVGALLTRPTGAMKSEGVVSVMLALLAQGSPTPHPSVKQLDRLLIKRRLQELPSLRLVSAIGAVCRRYRPELVSDAAVSNLCYRLALRSDLLSLSGTEGEAIKLIPALRLLVRERSTANRSDGATVLLQKLQATCTGQSDTLV